MSVTELGAALKKAEGQAPSAGPESVTATFATLVPSEMPMFPVAAAGPEGFRRRMVTVLPEIDARRLSLPEATKYVLLLPPATWTFAVASQLLRFTIEGEAASVGIASVPVTFATDTDVVRPAASRIVTGTPGVPMQAPVGVTVKPDPLAATTSGRTIKVEIEFATI